MRFKCLPKSSESGKEMKSGFTFRAPHRGRQRRANEEVDFEPLTTSEAFRMGRV